MGTTAGSLALVGSKPKKHATVVIRVSFFFVTLRLTAKDDLAYERRSNHSW